MKKRQHLQQICWKNWISTCRRLKLDPCLSSCSKTNSRCIKDLKPWNLETPPRNTMERQV
jgi:hypothetical protein